MADMPVGPVYVATFSAVAITAAQDVFEIAAPASSRLLIREIRIGQYSDAGDVQAELLSILIQRGYTVTGSGGTTLTPTNMRAHSGTLVASSTVKANNTTLANTGSAVTLLSDSFNVQTGFRYYPAPEDRIVVEPSVRLVIRISAPSDSITCNGTLTFQEVGKAVV